jgi:hypothetical protein
MTFGNIASTSHGRGVFARKLIGIITACQDGRLPETKETRTVANIALRTGMNQGH